MSESTAPTHEPEQVQPAVVAATPTAPAIALSPAALATIGAFRPGGARSVPHGLTPGTVMALQRAVGNRATARAITPGGAVLARQHPPPATTDAPPATTVQSGTDWSTIWAEHKLDFARTALEVARMYPGYGLLAGAGADVINIYQDYDNLANEEAPFVKTFMGIRSVIMVVNNGLGHLAYVNQLVQDGLAVSVVFVEFTPVSAATQDIIKFCKTYLDGWMFLLDFGLACGGLYRLTKAPPGSPSAKAWQSMVANYEANALGDLVQGTLDVIDLATGGFSNSEPLKQGTIVIRGLLRQSKFIRELVVAILQGWWNVWGGSAVEGVAGEAPAPAPQPGAPAVARQVDPALPAGAGDVARRVAAEAMLFELAQMKLAYETGDALLGVAADHIRQQMDDLNQVATAVLGGRDPFVVARDAAAEGLRSLEQRIGQLMEMQVMSTTAKEKAASMVALGDSVLAAIDALQVPDVKIPEAELGDNAVADAAEAVLNTAGSVANLGIQAIVDSIKEAVDEGKDTLRAPVLELKNSADDVAAFMQIVVEQAAEQIAFARNKITSVASKLEQCKSFEDVINLIMQQIFEMLGIDSDFKVEDIREGWKEVGTMIDDAIVWAEGLRSSGGPGGAPAAAPRTPAFAGGAAAEPPPGGGGGGGGDEPPDGGDGQGAAAAQAAGQARNGGGTGSPALQKALAGAAAGPAPGAAPPAGAAAGPAAAPPAGAAAGPAAAPPAGAAAGPAAAPPARVDGGAPGAAPGQPAPREPDGAPPRRP